jgi:hypothetical protein
MLPHWPIAMNIGIQVAFFVSEPKLCTTKSHKLIVNKAAAGNEIGLHHAMMTPMVV